MSPPKLLVFDLDGTLIDSCADLCQSVNAMLKAYGRSELPTSTIAGYIGNGAGALVRRALDATELSALPAQPTAFSVGEFEDAYVFFIRYYREHKLDHTKLYDGVLDALRRIRNAAPDLLMAVLTNKPVRPSREICRGLGIDGFFFQNYGGDSFPTKKPEPEGLLALIAEADALRRKRQGTSEPIVAAEVVIIGDSGVDVETARRCHVRSLGCTFGLAPESLAMARPDLTAHHAADWPAVLGFVADERERG